MQKVDEFMIAEESSSYPIAVFSNEDGENTVTLVFGDDIQEPYELDGPVDILRSEVEKKNKLDRKVRSIRITMRSVLLMSSVPVYLSWFAGIQATTYTLISIAGILKIGSDTMNKALLKIEQNRKILGEMFSSLTICERWELKDALTLKEQEQLELIAMNHVLSPDYWNNLNS
ncbi:MAG: hypothetical protein O2904_00335 [bacterium]|nr:hypothetical protein [bacterium]